LVALPAPCDASARPARRGRGSSGGQARGACPLAPTPTATVLKGPGSTDNAYSASQAVAFVTNQPEPRVLNHLTTTFDCVDSRTFSTDGTNTRLATPGGDFAELATGIVVYCRETQTTCDEALVERVFRSFMSSAASTSRPFYLHTSEAKLNLALDLIEQEVPGIERPPSLPIIAPADPTLRAKYLDILSRGIVQGCGHVRLMIDEFAAYGLDSPDVPRALIRSFYSYWWPTPVDSKERNKIDWPVLQGNLEGDAVLVISSAGSSGQCSRRSPALTHAWYGGQAFVYNQKAVEDFRKLRLVDFFKSVARAEGTTLDGAKFSAALQALQDIQLAAVLRLLDTAKDAPLIAIDF
jgi:hypothetical protein